MSIINSFINGSWRQISSALRATTRSPQFPCARSRQLSASSFLASSPRTPSLRELKLPSSPQLEKEKHMQVAPNAIHNC
eukprot:jgi/Chlat1/8247/Chrsp77S07684